jgi:hypothetical protein
VRGSSIDHGAGSSAFFGDRVKHVPIDVIDESPLLQWLTAADRQLQMVRIMPLTLPCLFPDL